MPSSINYTLPLDQLPDPLPIEPLTRPFDVTITPPGSKSITCRAYVLAALAAGESRIIRPLRADDTDGLLKALCTLGAEARWEGDDVLIKGVAGRFPRGGSVNLGDGGTPTRFMIACACLAAEPVIVDGSKRMRERPIAEGVEMLRRLGATIEYMEEEGRLPVRVSPNEKFAGGEIEIGQTQSSQFVSAVMLIASSLRDGLWLRYSRSLTSASYVELTRILIREFGVVFRDGAYGDGSPKEDRFEPHAIKGREYRVFADASSAVYWLIAASVTHHASVRLKPFSPLLPAWPADGHRFGQPDLGAFAALLDVGVVAMRFEGSLVVSSSGCKVAIDLNCSQMPDASLALAAYCTCASGKSRLSGLRTLRVKETDRVAALANELRKVGCAIETGEDWIEITPSAGDRRAATVRERTASPLPDGRGSLDPVVIETYNDHRMAMAFAILGLVRPGLSIRNPACVAKSYPGFWKDFAKLYR